MPKTGVACILTHSRLLGLFFSLTQTGRRTDRNRRGQLTSKSRIGLHEGPPARV